MGVASFNPYFNRGCIEDPACFFGRDQELSDVFGLLNKPIAQSTSIVGQRKIGKSSLLHHLMQPEVMVRYGANPARLVLVYVNFEGLAYFSELECFQKLMWDAYGVVSRLLPEEADALKIDAVVTTPFVIIEGLNRLFRLLRDKHCQLVFLFDEFELSCGNPNLSVSFFNTLRSFATNYGVAYVVATKQELWHLARTRGSKSSPFFNYFTTLYLGLFEVAEADAMLAAHGFIGSDDRRWLVEQAGTFPFFLQLMAWYAWELQQHPVTGDWRAAVLERFLMQATPHFEYFWSHLSPAEQSVMQRCAAQQAPDAADGPQVERLHRLALLARHGGRVEVFSRTFADFAGVVVGGPRGVQASMRELAR